MDSNTLKNIIDQQKRDKENPYAPTEEEEKKLRRVCFSYKDYGPVKTAPGKYAHVNEKGEFLVPKEGDEGKKQPVTGFLEDQADQLRDLDPPSSSSEEEVRKGEEKRPGILRQTPASGSAGPPAKEWIPDDYDLDSDDSGKCYVVSCKVTEKKKEALGKKNKQ